ncbi:uncharacterized protein VTP21DRAFT_8731 [Calcarisporiella thermophila]|uniref:uncharacterized protein n=1 Tax=Calcarisporiella thermophila TaxID=911321 RepID=UPI00374324BC
MGKWCHEHYDNLLKQKFRQLFEQVLEKIKEKDENIITFDEFADALDINDRTVRKLFEIMIKETAHKHSRQHPYNQSAETQVRHRALLHTLLGNNANYVGGANYDDTPGSSSSSGNETAWIEHPLFSPPATASGGRSSRNSSDRWPERVLERLAARRGSLRDWLLPEPCYDGFLPALGDLPTPHSPIRLDRRMSVPRLTGMRHARREYSSARRVSRSPTPPPPPSE